MRRPTRKATKSGLNGARSVLVLSIAGFILGLVVLGTVAYQTIYDAITSITLATVAGIAGIVALITGVASLIITVATFRSAILASLMERSSSNSLRSANVSPPRFGRYMLCYLPQKIRDEVIGDLEEEYHIKYHALGKRKAMIWYYRQIIASLWPFIAQIGELVWHRIIP